MSKKPPGSTINTKLELDNVEQLMKLMEMITENFYALEPKKEHWNSTHFRKFSSLIKDCESFKTDAKDMNFPAWKNRMTSVLSSLYYINEFKKEPTLANFLKTEEMVFDLDHDLKELFIWKHENAAKPGLVFSSSMIFILEDDSLYADTIAVQLENMGFDVQCFGSIEDIRKISRHVRPDLVLIDLNLQEGKLAGIGYLKEIGASTPTLVMSARQDIEARLQSVRAGAKEYVVKPINMDVLHALICKHLELDYNKKPKALIIDDDELTALTYLKFLESYDIDSRILTDASKALEEISSLRPDVIFMDLCMPYASGLEVANIIHQAYGKENSPDIVYMTGAIKDAKDDYDHHDLEEGGVLLKPLRPTQMANIIDKKMQEKKLASV